MCSAIVTNAIGAIVSIAEKFGVQLTNGIKKFGTPTIAASVIGVKSTIPTATPAKYPATIPIKNGITFKNPFAATATIAVVKNATNATTIGCHSNAAPLDNPILAYC